MGATPLWLSHHSPAQYDRCVLIGRHHVCRRCLLIWPLAYLVMLLALAGLRWPKLLDWPLLIVLPLPATIEFVLEHLKRIPYNRKLQTQVTIPMALALGVGFERYLRDQSDTLFWGCAVVYSTIYLAAVYKGAHSG
jgi:hypothetical protein